MAAIKLGVGVCTRERPYMFKALLRELAKQKIPTGAEVTFIFVENDVDVSIAKTVNEFREALVAGGVANPKICIEPEPKEGIGYVRNRMLEIALHFNLDFLAVADDDEYPENENWLDALFSDMHKRSLDIASGLTRYEPMDREQLHSFPLIPRIIYKSLARQFLEREQRSIARYRRGDDARTHHRGSNVIYRLSFLRQNNIRFKNLGLGRGEDQEIDCEIKKAGGKSGFVPRAIIYERVHDDRLTLRYQFQVQRANCIVNYGSRRLALSRKYPVIRGCTFVLARLITGTAAWLLVPLTGGRTLLSATQSVGRLVGVVEGLLGAESKHYSEIDGR